MKALMIFGFVVLSSTLIGHVAAQSDTSTGASTKIFPYKYEMRDLDNGLRVIVVPTSFPNLVSVQIPVQVGSRNEVEPGKSGFAHFFEHMMFRGTDNFTAEEYTGAYKRIGAYVNAGTSDDMTRYHALFSKDHLETVMLLESDRFKYLNFSREAFKTESQAVLGEYNKNFADPASKMKEVRRNISFTTHPYKHTTMGFLEDIIDMPNQFEFSRDFFDRFYRPEYTALILVGDLDIDETFTLVEKHWGDWERGNYVADIPQEPDGTGPIYQRIDWPAPTTPRISVSFRGPAFSVIENDMATMDVLGKLAFSSSSPIYQKLVIQEQKANELRRSYPDHKDPYLLSITAVINNVDDIWYVRDEIMKAYANLRVEKVPERRLSDLKSRLKYGFAGDMVDSNSIAKGLVWYVGLTRDPEAVNYVYQLYDSVTVDDVMSKANAYFRDDNLIVVSLASTTDSMPEKTDGAGSIDSIVKAMQQESASAAPTPATPLVQTPTPTRAPVAPTPADFKSLLQRTDSPLIDLHILFKVGAADDPQGKEGLAMLTAKMISDAGSTNMSYEDIQTALFPLAASFSNQVDKEMTLLSGTVHVDNLDSYYDIISNQLLNPRWDENDFRRIKTKMIKSIDMLKNSNDEELGKEVLYELLYMDHPYGHLNGGHITAIESVTIEDVVSFYTEKFTRANLVLGIAGNFSDAFLARVNSDLNNLPEGASVERTIPMPADVSGTTAVIVEKETESTAVSFGFPINVTRSHPDFVALSLANSYFGEHRSFDGILFQRIREVRGLNYGDYAYIEYFPRGMFQYYPDPNLGRTQQIFQVWIRPVESVENAHFATRTAMFELNKLINDGISEEDFEATRNFLLNYVYILVSTQSRGLGYALDSQYYGIDEFTSYMRTQLQKLTRDQVNDVIRKHLQDKNVKFVFITKDSEELQDRLTSEETSFITYLSEMPTDILDEDKFIQDYELDFEDVKIFPVSDVFVDSFAYKTDDTQVPAPMSATAVNATDDDTGSASSGLSANLVNVHGAVISFFLVMAGAAYIIA